MDFAVIRHLGKQHVVSVGSVIEINGIAGETGETVLLEDVLLTSMGDNLKIGAPTIAGLTVTAKIIDAGKGEKIRVAKFKAKSRYRKVMGFRPLISTLEILSIGGEASKAEPKVEKKTVKKPVSKKTTS